MTADGDSFAKIYAAIPRLACKGLCADNCTIILCQKAEREAIEAVRPIPVRTVEADGVACPMLDRKRGRCTVYAVRPLICRIYGTTKARGLRPGKPAGLRCPHGCRPKRWLSDDEASELIRRAQALSPDAALHADLNE